MANVFSEWLGGQSHKAIKTSWALLMFLWQMFTLFTIIYFVLVFFGSYESVPQDISFTDRSWLVVKHIFGVYQDWLS